jgi:hypothetical protein
MPRYAILLIAAAAALAGLAPANAQQPQRQPQARPCVAIRQVCEQAGFALNGARDGAGLVVHCIRPIMTGMPQPRRATRPLPAVDPTLIDACRARNPGFGLPKAPALRAPNEEEAAPQEEPAPPQ